MGRKNHNAFIKKQKEDRKRKKKAAKQQKKEERRQDAADNTLDDMIAYVDADGNPTSEPPEDVKVEIKGEDLEDENQP